MIDITSRAVLVSLRISAWSARKYDKKASTEVAENHSADIKVGRYNKNLLPQDSGTYKTLVSHLAAVRVRNYAETLAWNDEGQRMLPMTNYMEYTRKMREDCDKYESLLEDFLSEYPMLREAARAMLNGLYREEDYPTVSELRRRFRFEVNYSPIPVGSDFRISLSQEELDELSQATDQRIQEAVEVAHHNAITRLRECVEHIRERLANPEAIFRDSLIINAREVCDVLQRLNVTNDTHLEELRQQVERLAQVHPQELRESDNTRQTTANEAQRILDAMNSVYGGLNG